jgi:hypothetical protein
MNQLTYVEKVEESDGAVWKIVMYRILISLTFMILLTGLSESSIPSSTNGSNRTQNTITRLIHHSVHTASRPGLPRLHPPKGPQTRKYV